MDKKHHQPPEGTIVFANPDLGDPDLALSHAEEEASRIRFYRRDALVNVGKAATEDLAREQAAQAGVLHFATHATFEADRPLNSAILLSPGKSSDGRLVVNEIFSLQLPGSLVVLSACETAMGRVTSGDEIIGFTRAFMYAGSPHIVATLWSIDDEATSILMDKFCSQLTTLPPADSLRKAQTTIREKYAHPFFWASFMIYGLYLEKRI